MIRKSREVARATGTDPEARVAALAAVYARRALREAAVSPEIEALLERARGAFTKSREALAETYGVSAVCIPDAETFAAMASVSKQLLDASQALVPRPTPEFRS